MSNRPPTPPSRRHAVPLRPYTRLSSIKSEPQAESQPQFLKKRFAPSKPRQTDKAEYEQLVAAAAKAEDQGESAGRGTSARQLLMMADKKQQLQRRQAQAMGMSFDQMAKMKQSQNSVVSRSQQVIGSQWFVKPKKQEGQRGKSKGVSDIAFGDEDDLTYRPIGIPYFQTKEITDLKSTEEEENQEKKGKPKRPTLLNIDEKNRNAAKMFMITNENPETGHLQPGKTVVVDEDCEFREDSFLLVQLPQLLPKLVEDAPAEPKKHAPKVDDGSGPNAVTPLTEIPDGRIGTLQIYKSGKVMMKIGNTSFKLDQGSETHFDQQVMCVCASDLEAAFLGQVAGRVIVTPDLLETSD
ncbi:hypothetical protein FOZ61_010554 [Perkinsus olseni]|uniref:DNA-directed RNA polymerase III subunit RPC4 n=1 Tax=Perkinsus olseni TaxID=32597 RepID=A0A7J6M2P9_PEROL|nr:hypothetical protein FOZ61_010554 [Perkinsus olseni]